MEEPVFIRKARQAVEAEAEGRPDAATYREAGNAALNMVLQHWLALDHLNAGVLVQRKAKVLRDWAERRLQRMADKLARHELERHELQTTIDKLLSTQDSLHLVVAGKDKETGLPLAEALRRARDQGRTWKYELEAAKKAISAGTPPMGKRIVNARLEEVRAENLKLHQRVRELEQQLKAPPTGEASNPGGPGPAL
jgi:hypothetical protein